MAVRRATANDVPALVKVLAGACADDPFYRWLVPGGAHRERALQDLFELILRRMSHDLSDTFTTADATGVALWLPPGSHELSVRQLAGLAPGFIKVLGWRGIPRGLRVMQHMDRLHARFAPTPHIYLSVLGVEPAHQGRGLGSELLRPILDDCDARSLGAYLETARERNVAFYERHGFELRHREPHPEFPTFWCMSRAPR